VNAAACASAVSDPNLLATDLADYLVNRGMPFRKAHEAVGRAVSRCGQLGCELNELSIEEYKAISNLFEADIHGILSVDRSMNSRQAVGAPSPQNVATQIARWQSILT
jgi:argininosuccinate lyase